MKAFFDRLTALSLTKPAWWVWPSFLVFVALFCTSAALFLHAEPDGFCYTPSGTKFGETCAMIVVTGQPCPQCGMTRSWVYGARFEWITAFWHNPAGLTLLLWIWAGGIVGAARLAVQDARRFVLPWPAMAGWALFWLIGLYAIPWVLRLNGYNVLAN